MYPIKILQYKYSDFLKFLNVYLFFFERERASKQASKQAVEGQRKRETHNLKQALGSELSAHSPTWGSNS